MTTTELTHAVRQRAANTIRALAIDATNQADSGHPGAPMGLADIAVVLWGEVLRFDPDDPTWPDRDRFVLSNGHASMLLYAALNLSGYALPMSEIERFRQIGSKTPGHPEYGLTPGVETTTGPLGQGFAHAVGMALATRMAKARFNGKAGFDPLTHNIFGILGDGCMMEGITSEAASLAGHLGLGELIFIYDDNKVTIDGKTDLSFTEDVEKRFQAYGWHTLRVDGHDQLGVRHALLSGKAERNRPTLIIARTHIGYGSPNRQDSSKAHGEPLGKEEGRLAKEQLGITDPPFTVPDVVRSVFQVQADRGREAHRSWRERLSAWKESDPEIGDRWTQQWSHALPPDLWKPLVEELKDAKGGTRMMSAIAINALAQRVPALVGGSADLAGSNKTTIKNGGDIAKNNFEGRNIHFGIREHAMAAMVNGMALYGPFIPFGSTFLTFSDYMRPALRLSALMKAHAIEVFTHDSIGLGEDGPTHQSIEQLWALRLIPQLTLWRPADGVETAMAWCYAIQSTGPHVFAFSRQDIDPVPHASDFDPREVWKGGYVLQDRVGAEVVIVATGTEVGTVVLAAQELEKSGILARIVSMPSVEQFMAQSKAYREQVLPAHLRKVTVELGRTGPWAMVTGANSLHLGVDSFGESAPWKALREHFHMTPQALARSIESWLRA